MAFDLRRFMDHSKGKRVAVVAGILVAATVTACLIAGLAGKGHNMT